MTSGGKSVVRASPERRVYTEIKELYLPGGESALRLSVFCFSI